ncbi:Fic family protein [Lysobacter sp. H21R4]|uniref:Fic family protein n=1 Tax=Lysobacter sp. H21R4 TaxID=2781021 RepID=UPI001E5E17E8|nr:Fic family protein [Lysobacter sp. H21R4]
MTNAEDVEEVTNYLQAFRFAREQLRSPDGLPISVRLLTEAHRILLDGARRATLPALVRIALVHAQFETIHPFLDGKGRIGRLLIAMLLEAWQLLPAPLIYVSGYLKAH